VYLFESVDVCRTQSKKWDFNCLYPFASQVRVHWAESIKSCVCVCVCVCVLFQWGWIHLPSGYFKIQLYNKHEGCCWRIVVTGWIKQRQWRRNSWTGNSRLNVHRFVVSWQNEWTSYFPSLLNDIVCYRHVAWMQTFR